MFDTIREVLRLFTREGRGRWVLLVFLALLVSGMEMLGAAIIYVLLDLVANPDGVSELPVIGDVRQLFPNVGERELLLWIMLLMALFFLVRGAVKVGAAYAQSRVAHNAAARLSVRLMDGYLRLPYAFHLQRSSSDLIRNTNQAVMESVSRVVLPLIKVIAEGLIIIGLLTLLVVIAPVATAMAVVIIGGAAGLLLLIVQPRLRRLGAIHHEESQRTLATLQESLHGVRDVKLLGRERYFSRRYGRSRVRLARVNYLRTAIEQLPPIVTETALLGFILIFFTLVVIQGGELVETLSVLGLFGYAGLRLQPSIQRVISGFNALKYASAPVHDLDRDLRIIESMGVVGEEPPALPFREQWQLEQVSFRYERGHRDALTDVDLVVRPGEQIGICGPTGGGKTTLVDLMTGLLEPTSGRVSVDGQDLREHARAWQANLGVVPQMVFLLDDTLRANIAFGVPAPEVDEDAVREALNLAQLDDVVADLPSGLDTVIGERGVRISGGQRQRLAIARALYRRPTVLVFDEGTSALDTATEAELMAAIERLRGDHTIILIAHRLSTVRNSDRIVFVDAGRVAGVGTYEELARTNAGFKSLAGS